MELKKVKLKKKLTKYHICGHFGSFNWNLESAERGRPFTLVCSSRFEPVSLFNEGGPDGFVSAETNCMELDVIFHLCDETTFCGYTL